jgi:hypothetical protein
MSLYIPNEREQPNTQWANLPFYEFINIAKMLGRTAVFAAKDCSDPENFLKARRNLMLIFS